MESRPSRRQQRTKPTGSRHDAAAWKSGFPTSSLPLRHRIISMRPPWVAAQQPPERQPHAFERPVHPDRLDPVMTARRLMPAHPVPPARHPQPRRDGELVESDQLGEQPGHGEFSTFKLQDSTFKKEASGRVDPGVGAHWCFRRQLLFLESWKLRFESHRNSSTGTWQVRMRLVVVLPRMNWRTREWPYAPMTRRSLEASLTLAAMASSASPGRSSAVTL